MSVATVQMRYSLVLNILGTFWQECSCMSLGTVEVVIPDSDNSQWASSRYVRVLHFFKLMISFDSYYVI